MSNAEPRVVIVTGGGSGLGRQCALDFAATEQAAVVVADLSSRAAEAVAAEIRGHGGQALALAGDVTDEGFAGSLVEDVRQWRGRADVLVNNAGVADAVIPSEEQRVADWQRVLDISLRGMFLCSTRIAAAFLLPQGGGRIVSMGSIAGIGGLVKRNAYSAAKAGVLMMTRTLATEWAACGVTVNAVSPGYIRTPLTERLIEEGRVDEDALRRRTPVGDLGHAADVSAAVRFLASPQARYITGVNLPVDGGWSAWASAGDAWSPQEASAS